MTFPPCSRIERDTAVIVVVDVQLRLAAAMAERERVLDRCAKLIGLASIVEMPVIVTRQYPAGLGDIEPALAGALETAEQEGTTVHRADKVAFCCLKEPAFREALVATGRGQVVLAGMETHICIAQTAIALLEEGFDVHVAADAVCSRRDSDHATALARMGAAGANLTVAESVMYEAVGCAGTDEFKRLLALVKG